MGSNFLLGTWLPKGVAVAAVVDILHIGEIILDVDDLVIGSVSLGASFICALDVVDSRESVIVLDILVDILRVLSDIVNFIIIYDANASHRFLLNNFVLTVLTVMHEIIFFGDGDIQHVLTELTELHSDSYILV